MKTPGIALAALLIAIVFSSCAPTSTTPKYEPWDGPVEKLAIVIENTQRGLLELVSEDELYPLAVSTALNNSYIRQRFDIVDYHNAEDCDYKIIIRFINGSFSDVSPPSFSLGKSKIKVKGKLITVDLSGRLVSCRTDRILLSEHAYGTFLYIGDINVDYRQLISTPGVEQIMEGTITASKRALRELVSSIMQALSRG